MSVNGIGNGINSNQIESMLSLLRNTAAQASAPSSATGAIGGLGNSITPVSSADNDSGTAKVSFSDALKNSLGQVNQMQQQAQDMGDQFASGASNMSISDVMIATQKASIALQTAVQVRSKLVSAYTDIMNMQI